MLRIFVSSSFSGCGCILKLVLESGCCPSHLSDLLSARSSSLAATGNGADLLVDLADGLVDLAGLLPVLFFGELTLLVLLPVLLPSLAGLSLSLSPRDLLSLTQPLDVGLHVVSRVASVGSSLVSSVRFGLLSVLAHLLLPLFVLPFFFLFGKLGLLLKSLFTLDPLFLDSFFIRPHVRFVGLLPCPLNLDLSLALFLFLDTDRFLALPLFDHLGLLLSSFFSLSLLFLNLSLLLLLDKNIVALLLDNSFFVFTLDHLLVVYPSDSFLLDSLLLDGLFLDTLPLLFLPNKGLLSNTRLVVCDLADFNPFFFHLSNTLFVLLSLAYDCLLVDFSSPLLFFDLFVALFNELIAVLSLGASVAISNALPPISPLLVVLVASVLLVVRIVLVLFLLLLLVFPALLGSVDKRFTCSFLFA